MRFVFSLFLLSLIAAVLAPSASAQRFPQLMNMNTHEGKYATGGFGIGIGVAMAGGTSFRRERPGFDTVGGNLESVFRRRNSQNMKRSIFGADIDFQIGSDNSVIGTDFGIEIYSENIGTNSTRDFDNDAYTAINESVMLMYAGFDFTINLWSSEFIETDGRRTRENFGFALIIGPKVGLMFGDFSDLNGLASIGLDFGVMADIPISIKKAEDLLSISPYMFLEANYRMPIDGSLVDSNAASPTFGQNVLNDNFDIGFYNRSTDVDGNGTPDFDGIAVRRGNFIPAYQANIGFDFNITPIFVGRTGNLINNWRFRFSAIMSMPLSVKLLFAGYNGAPMFRAHDDTPLALTIIFGATYFF
jgi:hypothetical protein